jgi:hypothetical protein
VRPPSVSPSAGKTDPKGVLGRVLAQCGGSAKDLDAELEDDFDALAAYRAPHGPLGSPLILRWAQGKAAVSSATSSSAA